jgi:hypothetical protein
MESDWAIQTGRWAFSTNQSLTVGMSRPKESGIQFHAEFRVALGEFLTIYQR